MTPEEKTCAVPGARPRIDESDFAGSADAEFRFCGGRPTQDIAKDYTPARLLTADGRWASDNSFGRARLATFDDDLSQSQNANAIVGRDVGVNMKSSSYQGDSEAVNLISAPSNFGDGAPVLFLDGGVPVVVCAGSSFLPDVSNYKVEDEWIPPFSDSENLELMVDDGQEQCPDVTKGETMMTQENCAPSEACNLGVSSFRTPGAMLREAAIKVHAVVKFTRAQRLRRRAKWATKKLLVFVLSHVGLTSLVCVYAIAGGFLFQYLEKDSPELLERPESLISIREKHIEVLWNYTSSLNVLHPSEWKNNVNERLKAFEQEIYEAKDKGWDGINDYTPRTSKWTYPTALLFSVTIITTIGYGDLVPITSEGKIASMLYAVFGIPLVLLCLTNLGSFLATMFRFTWKHATHLWYMCLRSPKRNRPMVQTSEVRVPIAVSALTMVIYILAGAAVFAKWENWSFLDGSYFCFITLSTIGFGDFVPGQNTISMDSTAKRVVCALYLLFGLALLSMIFQLIQDSVTIVVRRYASFLGLSEKQIEKDIEDSVDAKDDDPVDPTKENGAVATKGDGSENGTEKATVSAAGLPDSATSRRFRALAKSTRLLRRESCPVNDSVATPQNITRLYSVPEVELSRQILSLNANKLSTVTENGSTENVREELCKKYTITHKNGNGDHVTGLDNGVDQ